VGILDLFKSKTKPDEAVLIAEIDNIFDDTSDYSRQQLERIWFRNILYALGEQWLSWSQTGKTFVRRTMPDWIPTPVSNEISDYVNSQKALLLNQKYSPRVWPNSSEKRDVMASQLAEEVLVFCESIDDYRLHNEREKAAVMMVLCGTSFIRTYPYKEGGSWFINSNGSIVTTGDVRSDAILPFNVRVDPIETALEDMRYIGMQSLKRKEWVEDTFGTKLVQTDDTQSLDYQKRLAKLVGNVSNWKGIGLDETGLTDYDSEDLCVFKEVEFKPSKKYPHGKYIVSAGGKILVNADRLPIKAEKGKSCYSLTDFHFQYVPGRFWSRSGVDDLISPQNTLNLIDQQVEINMRGLGRPRVITPGEIGIKRVNEGGLGLLMLQYDPLMSGGQKPSIEHGTPLPSQVFEHRNNMKVQIQDSSGDPKNILKGVPPSASASGIQVDILRDTAMQGHQPDVDRFKLSWGRVQKKRLLVVQELYTEERTIKIVGRGNKVNIKQFKASDLHNNTDVRMELDSGLSSTNAGKNQLLMQLAGQGMLGDVVNNPEIRQDLLIRMGLAGFADYENADIARADDENAEISANSYENIFIAPIGADGTLNPDDMPINDDPAFKFDNHKVHAEIHRRFILSSEFKDLPKKGQEVLIDHCSLHKILAKGQEVADAEAQAAMQAPQGGAPQQGAPQQGSPAA